MTVEKNIVRFCLDNFHLVEKARAYKYFSTDTDVFIYVHICIRIGGSWYVGQVWFLRDQLFPEPFLKNIASVFSRSCFPCCPWAHLGSPCVPAPRLLQWVGRPLQRPAGPRPWNWFPPRPDSGEPATEACKSGVGLGSEGNSHPAPAPCSVTDLAANFARNIHVPLFLTSAAMLCRSDWVVYIPARADAVSCYL